MAIKLKSDDELKIMREAGRIVANTLAQLREMVRPGLNLLAIEKFVREEFKRAGAKETFLNYTPAPRYPPYPSNICISINEQLVHGIPIDRELQEGDIVTFDLGATYRGYVGDAAITVGVGTISPLAQRLMDVTEASLWAGIKASRAGMQPTTSAAPSNRDPPLRFASLKEWWTWVGRVMHEEPQVGNFRSRFRA